MWIVLSVYCIWAAQVFMLSFHFHQMFGFVFLWSTTEQFIMWKCVETSNRSMFPYQKYHFSCRVPQEGSTCWVRPSGSWLSASLLPLLTLVVTQLLSLHWQMRFHHILNSLQRKMRLMKQIFRVLYIMIKVGLGSSRNIAAVLCFCSHLPVSQLFPTTGVLASSS